MKAIIDKPSLGDLGQIHSILQQWNTSEYAQIYLDRVRAETQGQSEYDRQYWIIRDTEGKQVLGICGLSDCQPKLQPFIKGQNPKEIRIVYLDNKVRGQGLGRKLIAFTEAVAKERKTDQVLLVSGQQYRDTAYGFYKKMGYEVVGFAPGRTPDKRLTVFSKFI